MGTTTLVDRNGNPLRSTKAGELFTAKRLPDLAAAVMAGKVLDTVGAGDTFNGALASALAAGQLLPAAVRYANAAAAICVTRAGAIPSIPGAREIEKLL